MPSIHFVTSDRTVDFEPGSEVNVLRVAIRNECGLPYKCASGNCGTDRIHIESGHEHLSPVRPKEHDRLGEAIDHGWRLACQTYTSGDVVISWDPESAEPMSDRVAEKLRERWLSADDDAGSKEDSNVG